MDIQGVINSTNGTTNSTTRRRRTITKPQLAPKAKAITGTVDLTTVEAAWLATRQPLAPTKKGKDRVLAALESQAVLEHLDITADDALNLRTLIGMTHHRDYERGGLGPYNHANAGEMTRLTRKSSARDFRRWTIAMATRGILVRDYTTTNGNRAVSRATDGTLIEASGLCFAPLVEQLERLERVAADDRDRDSVVQDLRSRFLKLARSIKGSLNAAVAYPHSDWDVLTDEYHCALDQVGNPIIVRIDRFLEDAEDLERLREVIADLQDIQARIRVLFDILTGKTAVQVASTPVEAAKAETKTAASKKEKRKGSAFAVVEAVALSEDDHNGKTAITPALAVGASPALAKELEKTAGLQADEVTDAAQVIPAIKALLTVWNVKPASYAHLLIDAEGLFRLMVAVSRAARAQKVTSRSGYVASVLCRMSDGTFGWSGEFDALRAAQSAVEFHRHRLPTAASRSTAPSATPPAATRSSSEVSADVFACALAKIQAMTKGNRH
ncbi:hypothetical protein CRT60_01115 [Azospirillum palustre]|uniref:Plasmid replication protein C N-terminal domain-containing protein n=1 Tax=Azospirillum palustre TaxID=2044885 RepID=A0A2B8BPB3_9PROT|nr:helix-turn-helix domain-containing protein [Azospirillum palustre]PGH59262.1 hypothetical protein CRT60_01115 [Azospirillum palustre]